jgi:hypothetical protein
VAALRINEAEILDGPLWQKKCRFSKLTKSAIKKSTTSEVSAPQESRNNFELSRSLRVVFLLTFLLATKMDKRAAKVQKRRTQSHEFEVQATPQLLQGVDLAK